MFKKGFTSEHIINKLREAEILLQQGATMATVRPHSALGGLVPKEFMQLVTLTPKLYRPLLEKSGFRKRLTSQDTVRELTCQWSYEVSTRFTPGANLLSSHGHLPEIETSSCSDIHL